MASKLATGEIVGLALGIFVLFVMLNAIYTTVNTSITTLNTTMTTAGNASAGNLVVTGWLIFQYVFGLGVLILAGAFIINKAKAL